MRRIMGNAVLAVCCASVIWGWSTAAATGVSVEGGQKQKRAKSEKAGGSMTGCVDQQDGRFVLVDDKTLNPIADLAAEGFPEEGFAKHLGHKVTVRGISSPGETRPLFKVRSIEALSETCAPQTGATRGISGRI